MRNILKADLRRILGKKSLWIFVILSVIALAAATIFSIEESIDAGIAFTDAVLQTEGSLSLVTGYLVMLAIYSDEFKHMAMIGTIGRGIPRKRYVLVKILDTLLVTAQICAVLAVETVILKYANDIILTGNERVLIIVSFVFSVISTAACVTMASIFFYMTENTAIGTLAYFTFSVILPLAFYLMQQVPRLAKYHIERFSVDGLTARATGAFIIGATGEGIAVTFALILVYIGIAGVISYAVFRKKELEF